MMVGVVSPFIGVLSFLGYVTACHVVLPAYRTTGYACGWNGALLVYRLNGPLVLALTLAAWGALLEAGGPGGPASFAGRHLWACWFAANVLGVAASACLHALRPEERPLRCLTADQKALRERAARGEDVQPHLAAAPTRGAPAHFFFGRQFNPRLGQLVSSLGQPNPPPSLPPSHQSCWNQSVAFICCKSPASRRISRCSATRSARAVSCGTCCRRPPSASRSTALFRGLFARECASLATSALPPLRRDPRPLSGEQRP